jgi:ubiquinone/menaquinone biosynthesis C-methylase UbiE
MKYKVEKVRDFWNKNPMNYDWEENRKNLKEGSKEFFKKIDLILFDAADFLDKDGKPFGKIIPFSWIKGKRVLEVGCGMGSISQLMALHGAEVTSIDLTPRAVANTNRRFELLKNERKNMTNLKQCKAITSNAQKLPFPDNHFDFVISWGVIHHAPKTQSCLKEIFRVLKKGGITSGMVYHKNSIVYYGHYMLLRGILMGKFLRYSAKELADRYSDGWKRGGCPKAEHFTKNEWKNMMIKSGFKKEKIRLFSASQTTDVYPPGLRFVDKVIPRQLPYQLFKLWGWFLCWDKVVKH